jgi:hypothetical protein
MCLQLQEACYDYFHLRQLLLGPEGPQGPAGDLMGSNFFADIYPLFCECCSSPRAKGAMDCAAKRAV